MSNPVLNDKAFQRAADDGRAGWAAPDASTRWDARVDDGPVSPYRSADDRMTLSGTITASGALFVLFLASATVGWFLATPNGQSTEFVAPPAWVLVVGIGAALSVWALVFRPAWARVIGPLYALGMGLLVGGISHTYESFYDGIVLQAVGATVAVFAMMLTLYRTRIIRVTDRFRRIVIGATLGLAAFYLVSWVVSLFAGTPSYMQIGSGFGLVISVVAAVLAAFNLALDFDTIERGVASGAPRHFEWFAATGLLVTIVWLYLELLRLLAHLRER
jgi:uncharacterized YccA/Bax inhibitor family protein